MSRHDLPEQNVRRLGPTWYRAAVRTAAVAGVFTVVVAAALVANHVRGRRLDVLSQSAPLTSEEEQRLAAGKPLPPDRLLAARMAALRRKPGDPELEREVRSLDVQLRRAHAVRLRFARTGAFLLLAGVVVSLSALLFALAFHRTLPAPNPKPDPHEERRSAVLARGAVGAVLVAFAAAGLSTVVPHLAERRRGPVAEKRDPATQWPRFRGPGGRGIAVGGGYPVTWDGTTGQNILWKTRVPLPGQNSPVIWGDRVFLSGADRDWRDVYCFDGRTGRMLWRRTVKNVPGSPAKPPEVDEMTGYAAPTMATDGRRVFAMFANGDVAAFDFEGRPLWAKNLGLPDNMYGHSASLTTHRHRLIVQFDQGNSAEDGLSRILALNVRTGGLEWETAPRPVPNSWGSPILMRVRGRDLLVAAGSPWVMAYDPTDGSEVWRARCLDGDVGPSPTSAAGVVYACNTGAKLVAIRADGEGDVTNTHILFAVGDNLPNIASPLCDGRRVFLAEGSTVTCYDARTGKLLWEKELADPYSPKDSPAYNAFHSSPTLVGDRVYLMDEKGNVHIFRSAAKYEPVGRARLGEDANTSPAFVNGRIYVRGSKHLFCIGNQTDGNGRGN